MVKIIEVFLPSVRSPRRGTLILVDIAKGTGQIAIKFIFSARTENTIYLTNTCCFFLALCGVDKRKMNQIPNHFLKKS